MLEASIKIRNPFPTNRPETHYWSWDRKVTAHKTVECQFSRFGSDRIVEVNVSLDWAGRDHAGPRFEIWILGFMFSIAANDDRHWDHVANRWEVPGAPCRFPPSWGQELGD